MLRNKLLTACSVAVLTMALYGCSSSSDDGANMQVQDLQDQIAALNAELGEGEELTPEALAALIQAKADAEAALADAMIAHQAALAAAAMDAETAKTAALAAAAMEAMTAQEAALAAAAMEAMTAHDAALAAAAMEAMTAQEAALAAAAMEAMTAHDAALAAAAMEAMTAHDAALAAAAIAAADMAAADKAAALADAKTAADAAQAMALADAKTAADAAQAMALADAKTAADAAQAMALADAKTAADAAQAMALADAKTAADAAQAMALADAKTAADAAQAMALADAKTAADAALKMVQDELDEAEDELADIKRDLVVELAAQAAEAKSEMAAEVLKSLLLLSVTAPAITLKASSSGALTAEAAGYAMSGTPEGISGFRGAILTKDGAEARVYTDIENAAATPILRLYRSASDPAELTVHYNVRDVLLVSGEKDILWSDTKRDDTAENAVGLGVGRVTTFAGSVRGLPGTFSCMGTGCMVPARNPNGTVDADNPGTWTFTPTNPSGTIDVVDKDGYLQFGWWLNPLGTRVEQGFEVATFAMASGYLDSAGAARGDLMGTLLGSATYTGGAAGKWAIASTTEDRTDGGHFTATATLGVNFDANSADVGATPDKLGVSVSGMITDFMTGDVRRPGWSVALSYDVTPNITTDGHGTTVPAEIAANATTTWTTGGAVDGTGTWEATFHGEEDETMHPMAVDGTFHAAIAAFGDTAVGRIQGAFGATK